MTKRYLILLGMVFLVCPNTFGMEAQKNIQSDLTQAILLSDGTPKLLDQGNITINNKVYAG